MKSNDLQAALSAFLASNPDLPEGEQATEEAKKPKKTLSPLHVLIEKKGRAGKIATIIEGLAQFEADEVENLCARLKKRFGCGGSWRIDEILLQGSRLAEVKDFLTKEGYKVK